MISTEVIEHFFYPWKVERVDRSSRFELSVVATVPVQTLRSSESLEALRPRKQLPKHRPTGRHPLGIIRGRTR